MTPMTEHLGPGYPRQLPGMARLMELTPELLAHYSDIPEGAPMPTTKTELPADIEVVRTERAPEPCPQAWHTGLAVGLLRECIYAAKHKGWHRDGKGLTWGGELTQAEHELAAELRKAVAA